MAAPRIWSAGISARRTHYAARRTELRLFAGSGIVDDAQGSSSGEVNPAAFRTVGEPGFAFLPHHHSLGDQRADPIGPLPTFGQAPRDRIRDPQHRFLLGP